MDYLKVPEEVKGIKKYALAAAAGGFLVMGALYFFLPGTVFFASYLVGYLFWLTIALGILGWLTLHHMTGGGWGIMVRRISEAAVYTIPFLAVFIIPVLFGIHHLYHWSEAEAVAHDPILAHKAPYLNVPFFILRTVFYFAVWIFLVFRLLKLSLEQDKTGDAVIYNKLYRVSAPGFLLLFLTATFASFDWLMSLDPHWFSSIYGVWFASGAALSGMSFLALWAIILYSREPLSEYKRLVYFHDYGKLMFAFVMFWAYISFSQFLIIWSGNLPEEIIFYIPRIRGKWLPLSVFLLIGHFVLPFLLLLSARIKKDFGKLSKIAIWLLFMHWIDIFWNVFPSLKIGESYSILFAILANVAVTVMVGGVFFYFFISRLEKMPLLPVKEPFLREALESE